VLNKPVYEGWAIALSVPVTDEKDLLFRKAIQLLKNEGKLSEEHRIAVNVTDGRTYIYVLMDEEKMINIKAG